MKLQLKQLDFISLDTLGFAQVGNVNYYEKFKIEKKVIEEHFKDNPNYAVPLPFISIAYFGWKSNNHDFGIYYDFCIFYDLSYLTELENNGQDELITLFWEWVNNCEEALNLNEEKLMAECNKKFNV